MKINFFIALIVLFSTYATAQEKKIISKENKTVNVPELVKNKFTKNYPAATKVKWSLEKAGDYEAEFNLDMKEMSVVIDNKGNLLMAETKITKYELPEEIKAALARDYNNYMVDEFEKAEAKGVATYEMVARKNEKEYELVFDSKGKLVKKGRTNELID